MPTRNPTGTYSLFSSAEVGIYAKKSGVWTRVTTRTVSVAGTYTDGSPKTLTWYIDEPVQLGSGVQAFGASIETVNGYSNTSAIVNKLALVSWQAIGSSGGVTSATPDGQTTTVTVRPQ